MTQSDDRTTSELPTSAPAAPTLDQWFGADATTGPPNTDPATEWVDDPAAADDLTTGAEVSDALDRDELLLAAAPSNVSPDELDAALASPPPSARSLRLTKVLGVAVVVALAFVGGIALGQRTGQSAAAGPAGAGQFLRGNGQGFPGGFPTSAPGGQAAAGADGGQAATGQDGSTGTGTTSASTTTGTVKLVDGSVIYLADADGNLTRVTVDQDTDITTSKKAELDDISTGDSVTVTGTTTNDGVAAATVAVTP